MSTLTQFLGGGIPLGSGTAIFDVIGVGTNPTVNGQEFLARGWIKAYSSTYAPLMAISKGYGVQLINTTPGTNWGGGFCRVEYSSAGSTYYQITRDATGTTRRGTSFTGAATSTGLTVQASDSLTFKTVALASGYSGTNGEVWYGNGGNWVGTGISASFTVGEQVLLAASPTKAIAIQITTYTNGAQSSDGITWTYNAMTGIALTALNGVWRLTWSPVGNCFILVGSDNKIYTSANGVAWTLRTTPSGMVSAPDGQWGYSNFQNSYCASSATSTLIWLGKSQYLRTTDGINFSLYDLRGTAASSLGVQTLFDLPAMIYDGTQYIVQSGQNRFTPYLYSTDGITWNYAYRFYSNTQAVPNAYPSGYNDAIYYPQGISYVNSRTILTAQGSGYASTTLPYDITGKFTAATPDYVGDINTDISGTNTFEYFIRIA